MLFELSAKSYEFSPYCHPRECRDPGSGFCRLDSHPHGNDNKDYINN